MVVFVVADHLPKVLGIIRLLFISIRAYYWKISSNNFSCLVKLIRERVIFKDFDYSHS